VDRLVDQLVDRLVATESRSAIDGRSGDRCARLAADEHFPHAETVTVHTDKSPKLKRL
jgi:hypothetical protein